MDNTAQNSSSSQNYQTNPSKILGKVKSGFSGNAVISDPQSDLSTKTKLKVLEEVLDEVESKRVTNPVPNRIVASGMVAQAMPKAADEVVQLQQAQQTGSTQKEAQAATVFESIPGAQVEYEESAEIAPEVEAFVQKVEEQDQLPQEIAVNAENIDLSQPIKLAKKAVVVLPITPEIEKVGEKKNPKYSIRWLVEFAKKIMKIFNGEVIYRESKIRNPE
ncbi:MAG: hypothetical protein ABFQ62_02835 [Patescibacteria group bacterium]